MRLQPQPFLTLFLVISSLLFPYSAPAKVVYVAQGATGDGSGSSWENACTTITAGLTVSASGDEIWVKSATYGWLGMHWERGVAIYGGFAGSEETRNERDWARNKTIITDVEVPVYCYRVSNVVLDGFTLTGGTAGENVPGGAGICIENSSLTIVNCVITDNHASETYYTDHQAGGGAYCGHSTVTFLNCAIYENSAADEGGGLYIWDSSVRLIFCTIAGNNAWYPGGGGMYCYSSSITLDHCVVSGNESSYGEDGIMVRGSPSEVTVVYSCVQGGWSGTGSISADPWFADSDNQDYSLRSRSRCIDAGTNDAAQGVPFDLGRRARVIDGDGDGVATVDMGAYEFQPPPPPDRQLWILDAHGQVHHLPAPTPTP